MAFVSSFSFMSDCAPSANEVQDDADERHHDQNVDGRRGDVKDAESRDPGDEQDDSQPKQHLRPFRRAPQSRSAPRLVCGFYENKVGTTARLARSMAHWRFARSSSLLAAGRPGPTERQSPQTPAQEAGPGFRPFRRLRLYRDGRGGLGVNRRRALRLGLDRPLVETRTKLAM